MAMAGDLATFVHADVSARNVEPPNGGGRSLCVVALNPRIVERLRERVRVCRPVREFAE
jgi:hypothetical protein